MLMTNGLGAVIGSYAAGFVVHHQVPNPSIPDGWDTAWFIFAAYALVVAILFAVIFRYKHKPNND
jgi:MFS family permease